MSNEIIKQEAPPAATISINLPDAATEVKPLISDKQITDYYTEAIESIKEDRKTAGEMFDNFCDMVLNNGDATSSSKETLVGLLKIKTEASDKMIKILDLWTRMKLRERDTFPAHLAINQHNKIDQRPHRDVRKLIDVVSKMEKTEDESKSE